MAHFVQLVLCTEAIQLQITVTPIQEKDTTKRKKLLHSLTTFEVLGSKLPMKE